MQVIDAMQFNLEIRCRQAQHMAAERTTIADEVVVIPGDADRSREWRAPESDQSSGDVLENEFSLMRSRID